MSKLDYLDKIIKKHIPSAYHNDSDEPCDFLPVKEIEKIAREASDLGRLEEREALKKIVEGMKKKEGLIVIGFDGKTKTGKITEEGYEKIAEHFRVIGHNSALSDLLNGLK